MLNLLTRITDYFSLTSVSNVLKNIFSGLYAGCNSLLLDYIPNRYDKKKILGIGQDWANKFNREKSKSAVRAGAMVPGAILGFGLGQILTTAGAIPLAIYVTFFARYNPIYREMPLDVYRMPHNKKMFMLPALSVYSVFMFASSMLGACVQFLYSGVNAASITLKLVVARINSGSSVRMYIQEIPSEFTPRELSVEYQEHRAFLTDLSTATGVTAAIDSDPQGIRGISGLVLDSSRSSTATTPRLRLSRSV